MSETAASVDTIVTASETAPEPGESAALAGNEGSAPGGSDAASAAVPANTNAVENDNGKPPTPEEKAAADAAEAERVAAEAAKAEAAQREAVIKAAIERNRAKARAARQRDEAFARARQEAMQAQAERDQLRAEAQRLAERAKLADEYERDPLTALEKRGLPPEQLAERVLRRGTPEEKFEVLARKLDETKQQYEARLAEFAQREQQREQREQAREHEMREAAARSQVLEQSRANATQHELLMARYGSEQALVSDIARVSKEAFDRSGGRFRYSVDEVLEHLAGEAKSLAERLTKATSATASQKTTESKQATSGQKASPAGNATRTLSNSTATQGYSLPANLEALPEDEQNQHLAEMYRRLRASGA
jgi:hypothetical protein